MVSEFGSCQRKAQWTTRRIAQDVATNHRKETGDRYRVYKCPWCSLFHLTHDLRGNEMKAKMAKMAKLRKVSA
jgi:hypothetical protein